MNTPHQQSNNRNVRLASSGVTRRDLLTNGALAGGAMLLGRRAAAQHAHEPPQSEPASQPAPPKPDKDFKFKEENPARANVPPTQEHYPPGEPGKDYTPVVVTNGWTLPYKIVDG